MIVGNGEVGRRRSGHHRRCRLRHPLQRLSFLWPRRHTYRCGSGLQHRPAGEGHARLRGSWRAHPGIVDASEIWSVRDLEKFAAMRAPLAVSHPELDDFCDDYTDLFGDFCTGADKLHRIVSQRIHDAVDRALATLEPAPYVVPSSGIIVIGEVLDSYPNDEVV